MSSKKLIIKQTKKWLSDVIIEHGICPFAKQEYENNHIHYEVIEATGLVAQLEQLILDCEALDDDLSRETSLLIFPKALADFENYLEALEIASELMAKQGYEGTYQIASFHPRYRFADTALDDASNYTNRSPYPMWHILREASIEKALLNVAKPEKIPERNIAYTRALGLSAMRSLLSDCYEP